MDDMKLYDISERYMELINPCSVEKILKIGQVAGLGPTSRVIEFGCGFGEVLAIWAEAYGITGVGMDVREYACERARQKMVERGLADRIEIVHGNGAEYAFEPESYDLAACIGASFIWGGFPQTLAGMRGAIGTGGRMAVGEPYWLTSRVPPEYLRREPFHCEHELLALSQEAGFDWEFAVRASHDDWDTYEATNWRGLVWWIEHHADHPDRQQVIDYLHRQQEEYTRYGREYLGWAIYLLRPQAY